MLPKIVKPKTTIITPITQLEVMISPYTMADQKSLLIMSRSDNENDILNAILEILKNCSNVDPKQLNPVEVQWLMLQIRSISAGGMVEVNLTCNNVECGKQTPSKLNLAEYVVNHPKEMSNMIVLDETMGIKLKTIDISKLSKIKDDDEVEALRLIMDYVYDANGMYSVQDVPYDELKDFIESLSLTNVNLMTDWMRNIGSMQFDKDWKCPHCGHANHIHIEGIKDFFI